MSRKRANAELESGARILHQTSGLYCEHGHGQHKRETHIFLSKEDNVPMQICKSALEVAAFLGGYSRAAMEYLPIIIAAVALTPNGGPAHKLLNDFICRNKSCYSVVPEPELEQDSSKINETRLIFNSWTCSSCGGTYSDRDLAIKHALDCDDNEDVHACNTCKHNRVILGDGEVVVTCNFLKTRDKFVKYCTSWAQKNGL